RARPGFVRRVLQLGLPAGIVVGTVTFVTYLQVRTPDPSELVMRQTYTATLACLIVAATWVLAVVARPYRWWRIALVLLSLLAYLLIFTWPFTQSLFFLDTGNTSAMGTGLLWGLVGAVLIEALWWLRGKVFGAPLVFWSRS
ncbi:MAG: cation-translocating P-type ATPase, partial [Micropruina glycogenica]